MQIYANHIQIHIKIASCGPPHLLERILEALYYLSQEDTPGTRDVRGSTWKWARGVPTGLCALWWGEGREATEDSLNTAVQSEMCGSSKINFEMPGSEDLHPISASTWQPQTRLPLFRTTPEDTGGSKGAQEACTWFEGAHQL